MIPLSKIKLFFEEKKIDYPVVVDGCQHVTNVNDTALSLINFIERENNQGYQAYYKTLLKIYNQCQTKNTYNS